MYPESLAAGNGNPKGLVLIFQMVGGEECLLLFVCRLLFTPPDSLYPLFTNVG
jgi:hypothetical protein